MREASLEKFLLAAGQLQYVYFVNGEWPQVRDYNKRIQEMLKSVSMIMKISPYAQVHQAQADMIFAFEMRSRGALRKATALFQQNLGRADVEDASLAIEIGYTKVRMMNSLGLLQCEIERADAHIRELDLLSDALHRATARIRAFSTRMGSR